MKTITTAILSVLIVNGLLFAGFTAGQSYKRVEHVSRQLIQSVGVNDTIDLLPKL